MFTIRRFIAVVFLFILFSLGVLTWVGLEFQSLLRHPKALTSWIARKLSIQVKITGAELIYHHWSPVLRVKSLTLSSLTAPNQPVIEAKGFAIHVESLWDCLASTCRVDSMKWSDLHAHISVNKQNHLYWGLPEKPLFLNRTQPDSAGSFLVDHWSAARTIIDIHHLHETPVRVWIGNIDFNRITGRPAQVNWGLTPRREQKASWVFLNQESDSHPRDWQLTVKIHHANIAALSRLFLAQSPIHLSTFSFKGQLGKREGHWFGHWSGLQLKGSIKGKRQKSLDWSINQGSGHWLGAHHPVLLTAQWPVSINGHMAESLITNLGGDKRRLTLRVSPIDLFPLSGIEPELLSVWGIKQTKPIHLQGQIMGLRVALYPHRERPLKITAQVKDIGWLGQIRGVAMKHLFAFIEYSPAQRRWVFRPKISHAHVSWEGVLPEGSRWVQMREGTIELFRSRKTWHVVLNHLAYTDSVVGAILNGRIDTGQGVKQTQFRLGAEFHIKHLARVERDLPLTMPSHTRHWFVQALKAGEITRGVCHWNGALSGFPYRHQSGDWRLSAHFKNLSLQFSRHWPAAEKVQGDVSMHNQKLTFQVSAAQLGQNSIVSTSGKIADLFRPILKINGRVKTRLENAMAFLRRTPLSLPHRLHAERFIGPAEAEIQLRLNLMKHLTPTTLRGKLYFHGDTIGLPAWNLWSKNVSGVLYFTHKSASGSGITGRLLGSPIVLGIQAVPAPDNKTTLTMSAQGEITQSAIKNILPFPWLDSIKGRTRYKARLRYHSGDTNNALIVTSSLKGFAFKFPHPLNKALSDTLPTTFKVDLTDTDKIPMRLMLGDKASVNLLLNQKEGHNALVSGLISVGSSNKHLPKVPGLSLDATLSSLNMKDWLPLLEHYAPDLRGIDPIEQKHGVKWHAINIQTKHLFWGTKDLSSFHAVLHRSEKEWALDVRSDWGRVQGLIPLSSQSTWRLDARDLKIKALKNLLFPREIKTKNPPSINWSSLPKLHVTCRDCHYGNNELGLMTLQYMGFKDNQYQYLLTWNTSGQRSQFLVEWDGVKQTRFSGQAHFSDLGRFISDSFFFSSVKAGKGNLEMSGSWPGSPLSFSQETLLMYLNVSLDDLAIINLPNTVKNSLSFMNLLNVLSIDHLLPIFHHTSRGWPIQSLNCTALVQNKVISTHHCLINGLNLHLRAQGQLSLSDKQLKLNLTVHPQVTGSLPLLATLAAGAGVGLFVYAANRMLHPLIDHATERRYILSGPIKDLSVTPVDAFKSPK